MLTNIEGLTGALLASFSVIMLSEVGDKTFFIAAVLAMRQSRTLVFSGAMAANTIMYILTVGLGFVMSMVPPTLTRLVSSVLFAVFGLQMIKEGWTMSPDESEEELEEAEEEIQKRDEKTKTCTTVCKDQHRRDHQKLWTTVISSTFVQAFSLTFVAEWGDRSQVATILLGASRNVAGVIIGGLLGHTVCTGFAVLSGRLAAKHISLPKVHILGGLVFLMFSVAAFFLDD